MSRQSLIFQLKQKWRAANPPEIHVNALARAGKSVARQMESVPFFPFAFGVNAQFMTPLSVWCERSITCATGLLFYSSKMFKNITAYLGEFRCGVCACVCVLTCTCVDGGAVMFKNITSYLGECVAAFVLTCVVCTCVCVQARVCVRICVCVCLCFRVCSWTGACV